MYHDDVERDVDVDSVMLVPHGSDVVFVILEQRVVKIDNVIRRGTRTQEDWKDTKQRKYTEELELQFDSISVLAPSDNEH